MIGSGDNPVAFSFYATKNLTTGEGGMITTRSAESAERIRIASQHGMTRPAWTRYRSTSPCHYDVVTPGFKYNMTDLQAAIGLHQLEAIPRRLDRRAALCDRYDAGLADLPISRFAPVPAGVVHARHLYTVLIDHPDGPTRDEIIVALSDAGVASSVHFPPVHLHSFYARRYGFVRGQFPAAERIAGAVLSLPLSPALTDEQLDHVIGAMRRIFGA
jgi:dTDP-4-amino-4,6-dideoxygalactose transaminase